MKHVIKTSYGVALLLAVSFSVISFLTTAEDRLNLAYSVQPHTQVAQVASTLGNGLATYYRFDETSGTVISDYSGNGRDGTLVSSPVLSSDARVGTGAITFSGVNKVSGSSISIPSSDYSFAFWMKTTDPSNSMLGLGYNSFCAFNGKSISCTVDGNISGSTSINEPGIYSGSWHHVVFVVTSNVQKLYIDGVERATGSETPASPGGAVSVGVRNGSNYGFVGSLDDVRFYTRALTSSEISTLASGSSEGSSALGSNVNTTTQTSTNTTTQTSTSQTTTTQTQTTQGSGTTPAYSVLTIAKSGDGSGVISSPSGINCGSSCSLRISTGSVVKLYATNDANSTVTGWSGGGCSGNSDSCVVTVSGDMTVTTTFSANVVSSTIPVPSMLQITESYFAHASIGQYNDIEFFLRWKDNASDEEGYVVEKSVDGAPFTIVKRLAANTAVFIDRALNTSIYKYRVKAFKGASYSLPSNTLEFTGIPQASYFIVETDTINSATVYFHDRTIDTNTTIGYQIERSDDGGNTYKIISRKISSDYQYVPNAHGSLTGYKKFIDNDNGNGLTPGKTYYYRVAGYNNIALSPYTNKNVPAESTTPFIIVTPGGVPNTPDIAVSVTQTPSVRVKVVDNSNNEAQFEVQKSTNNTNWSSLCTISWASGDKACEDRSIVPGGKYYYRVRAYNNSSLPASVSNIYASSDFAYSDPVILAGAAPTGVTEWYVWKGATAGTNTGESWANAWQDIDQINWKAIKPGDSIYMSGDDYGKPLSIYGSGTQTNPIKIYTGAQSPNPSGHSGKVTLNGIFFNQNASWINIDGSINKNYNLTSALNVDDNINLVVDKSVDTGIYSNGSNGVNLRFIKVSNSGGLGVYFNGLSDLVEVYGVHVYYTVEAGVRFGYPSNRKVYDALKVTKTLIEYTGDDAIQTGGTLTVADTIIRRGNLGVTRGHPDGIQGLNANYLDVHNTTIYDREVSSYMIVNEFMMTSIFTDPNYGHIRIYNNEFYYTNPDLSPVTSGIYTSAAIIIPAPVDYENWDDILIANNTFYNTPKTTPISFGVRDQISKVTAKNIIVKNNLLYNVAKDVGVAVGMSPRVGLDSSSRIDNNLVAGYTTKITFGGTLYDNAEAFNVGTGFKGNTSATPKFVNLPGFNLRLASDDTAARGKGEKLSQYFNFDKDNTLRPSSGAWDIGAYQGGGTPVTNPIPTPVPPLPNPAEVTSGLILNINFDNDDFTTKGTDANKSITFKDTSGKNFNGTCQTALPLNGTTHDQCPQLAPGVKSGNSARFAGNLCDMSSDYIGIPTGGELSYLTKGTVSVYAAFDNMSYLGQHIIDTYTADINNTWALHLDGDRFPTLTIVDDAGSAVDIITFPTSVKVGDWNNYSFTWDGTYIKTYFNGMFAGQARMTAISGLKFFENPSKGHTFGVNYMTLGAMKHNEPRNYPDANCYNIYGYPKQSYVYPNAGWMTGRIDEVRIYNRDLSSVEVSSLSSLITNSGQSVLSVSKQGDGDGYVSTTVAGVGCGKHCAEAFNTGTALTLKALPQFNSKFVAWGGACSGTSATCTVTLNSNTSVTATFSKIDPVTVTLNASQATSISDPFTSVGGSIFQYKATTTPGRAQFDFTLPEDGEYSISGLINAPSQGSNSFYINFDDEPDPKVETNGWYIPTTGGYETRFVNWGGDFNSGVRDANGVSIPRLFTLSAGSHKLIVRGREEGTAFRSFDIIRKGGSTTVVTQPNPGDKTPPVISAVTDLGKSGKVAPTVVISWNTNEVSDAQVEYGLTTAYGSVSPLSNDNSTSHQITVTNLAPRTQYHYRVKSTDPSGNVGYGVDKTFVSENADNLAPIVTVKEVTSSLPSGTTSIKLEISTDEISMCVWSKTQNLPYNSVSGNSAFSYSSTNRLDLYATVTGLVSGTNHVYVKCADIIENITGDIDVKIDVTPTQNPTQNPPVTGIPVVTVNDSDGDGVPNTADKCPYTKPGVKVNRQGCPEFTSTRYNTPDFSNTDLNSVSSLEIIGTAGKISYPQGAYDLSRDSGDPIDLDSNLTIVKGSVSLDSTKVPELNKPATVTLYNITARSPKIMRDGVECVTCKVVSFSNGTLVFTVPGFSTYSIIESDNSPATYTVTVSKLGTGSGVVTGTGIDCGSDCSETVNDGVTITLTAIPDSNTTFDSWSGGTCTGNSTCGVTDTVDKTVIANFTRKQEVISNTPANNGGGGGGGGGGGISTTYITPGSTQPTNNSTNSGGVIITVTAPAPVINPAVFKTLYLGATSPVVKSMQQTLNSKGYIIANSGAGSKGSETTYFGNGTRNALKKYQCAVMKVCSGSNYGILDQATYNSLQLSTLVNQVKPTTKYKFAKVISLGSVGEDVRQLQIFLNNHGYTVATTGSGSKGKEVTNFGPATKRALIRYQVTNGIVPANGLLGSVTRNLINATK